MIDFNSIFSIIGLALCAMALLQMGMFVANSMGLFLHNSKQYRLSQKLLREEINVRSQTVAAPQKNNPHEWTGFRPFIVDRLHQEANNTTSVYLAPEDGKSIPDFRPGQHLTFKFPIPGQPKPVIRCYSLSDGPGKDYYRITVKQSLPPRGTEHPPGLVSSFVNSSLMAGDRIDVKAPSGHFFLDESTDCPIVLMAGGVGITPMISMIDRIIQTKSDRLVVLIYGVSDGADHPFKNYLKQASQAVENFHVVNCYAHPRAEDQAGVDYQVNGYASVELIKKLLPNNHCQFYMCGPPPFMKSLYNGLTEWLVPDERIFFEAFGPASIKRSSESGGDSAADVAADEALVTFTKSNKSGNWNTDYSSLLEMAEANNIEVESGCRAGSCGTCELGLLKGKVNYPPGQTPDCPPGACLPCIAKPAGPVELEA